jgi:hypothetical protein
MSKKITGRVELDFSIDVPSEVTKEEETKYIISAIKKAIAEASTKDLKFGIDKDAEWTMFG